MKIKTCFAQMIVDMVEDKPYYGIMYLDTRDGECHVGFGSFDLKNTFARFMENFELESSRSVDPFADLKNELKVRCVEIAELKQSNDALRDENSKLGIQYEKLLKEKSDLDRRMGYFQGQVEAYQYVYRTGYLGSSHL